MKDKTLWTCKDLYILLTNKSLFHKDFLLRFGFKLLGLISYIIPDKILKHNFEFVSTSYVEERHICSNK